MGVVAARATASAGIGGLELIEQSHDAEDDDRGEREVDGEQGTVPQARIYLGAVQLGPTHCFGSSGRLGSGRRC